MNILQRAIEREHLCNKVTDLRDSTRCSDDLVRFVEFLLRNPEENAVTGVNEVYCKLKSLKFDLQQIPMSVVETLRHFLLEATKDVKLTTATQCLDMRNYKENEFIFK
jgi:hypothetical protein